MPIRVRTFLEKSIDSICNTRDRKCVALDPNQKNMHIDASMLFESQYFRKSNFQDLSSV